MALKPNDSSTSPATKVLSILLIIRMLVPEGKSSKTFLPHFAFLENGYSLVCAVLGSKPEHLMTGSRGYLGKSGSSAERVH